VIPSFSTSYQNSAVLRDTSADVAYLSPLQHDVTKADGQMKKTACNDKLKGFLALKAPDFKFTPMSEGTILP
jgi:hypothetical protein